MRQTWRWFGPHDTVQISDLRQIGVEGVVSALHHVPTGDIWTSDEIAKRQQQVATLPDGRPSGIAWEVVESLPVSETLKTKGPDWDLHIANYITSLQNLAAAGLQVICYNFMPVLDWTRTELRAPLPSGGTAMRFDLVDFAVFDMHILARAGAAGDYPPDFLTQVTARYSGMTQADCDELQHNIVAGLPGANDGWSLDDIKRLLQTYADIDTTQLRANLIAFLRAVVPTAEQMGLRLCCHPDDPPFSLMGLPRIMSSPDDFAQIMRAVDSPANGITLCTGSMGVAKDVDFVRFIENWGHRIHFAHLRNTSRTGPPVAEKYSFFEDAHLEGDTDMVAVVRALLEQEAERRTRGRPDAIIPMRPDHGHELLDDLPRKSMPGYPLIGRMRGLAELRGIMAALG
ncbi:mannonate dehydratase [Yoonia sediminilitoris]|uniref:Mannonate dehydratase n=1 Tax=Yoonia sediminilitoris TaxID=1286148 RepID=A0A2T6KPM0_9RHOB|nr:mannonate dehydratase [Yoonia sediminilitoris]PUB18501.1 D-mannonate dehydratase [Yoonia sediminilitoris]RCW98669.1 D-mannonate dehydratase [Yoonia sediminilitoris]